MVFNVLDYSMYELSYLTTPPFRIFGWLTKFDFLNNYCDGMGCSFLKGFIYLFRVHKPGWEGGGRDRGLMRKRN